MLRNLLIPVTCVGALALSSTTFGYVVYGNSAESGIARIYDPSNPGDPGTATTGSTSGIAGMAANITGQRMYISLGSTLRTLDFSGNLLNSVTTVNTGNANRSMSLRGLGFNTDNSTLYGVAQQTTNAASGLYSVDPSTGAAAQVVNGGTAYNFQGVDYDANGQRFIATTFNTTGGAQAGVYEILLPSGSNPSGAINLLVGLPNSELDVDGVAVNNGVAYLTVDEIGSIYPLALNTLTYGTPIPNTYATSGGSAGATWAPGYVPEPGSLGVLAAAGLGLLRRRRI